MASSSSTRRCPAAPPIRTTSATPAPTRSGITWASITRSRADATHRATPSRIRPSRPAPRSAARPGATPARLRAWIRSRTSWTTRTTPAWTRSRTGKRSGWSQRRGLQAEPGQQESEHHGALLAGLAISAPVMAQPPAAPGGAGGIDAVIEAALADRRSRATVAWWSARGRAAQGLWLRDLTKRSR